MKGENVMFGKRLRRGLLLAGSALALTTTTALAGSGVGGVFNLGQTNSVNATSTLAGTAAGPQLRVQNASTAASAFSLYGLLTATAPAGNDAAVRGQNNATNSYGYGVWGSQAGAGTGVYGTGASGTGVYGFHTGSTGTGAGVYGRSASASGAGVLGYNSAGGPGLQATVSSNAVPPLKVNSSAQVANLNASLLGGHASTYFLPTTGTAANSSKLGGNAPSFYLPASGTAADSSKLGGLPAKTFYRSRAEPLVNGLTTADPSANVGANTSVTIGADGLPFVSYRDYGNGHLKVLHCGNTDCSAGFIDTTVDFSADVGQDTSVTVGADGLPFVSYQDHGNGHLKVLHCGNVFCTSGDTITTADSSANVGANTSVTIGVDGLPLVSYWDGGNGHLKVLHCGNAVCNSGNTVTTADVSPDVGQDTSVTIGADGLPFVSYLDYGHGNLRVLHCGNVDCTSGNADGTVDATTNVGAHTSVTIGADGLPIVSYQDWGSGGHLKVLHCGTVLCGGSGNTALTVDSNAGVGADTSVTIGADGLPLVSYLDYGSGGHLKVLHCGSTDCSSGNTMRTVDSRGSVGAYTSVTIGADALPFVTYWDSGSGHLMVAHCANAFCVPYFRRR
jgi:hypothetical protein